MELEAPDIVEKYLKIREFGGGKNTFFITLRYYGAETIQMWIKCVQCTLFEIKNQTGKQ